jgi:rhodanese-related sulfurtransferase
MTATISTISPQELHQLNSEGKTVDLIDVRTPAEYQEIHVTYARNVPLDKLNPESFMSARNGTGRDPLYVVCRSGNRSKMACEKFVAAGYENVVNVEGGTQACEAADLPVVRGRKVMSLERQVRIVAGLIVLVGALLGIFVHEYFAAISAFVGAGLVFAGITDTCGMGMLLAKMPWNQVRADGPACTATSCQTDSE